MWICETKIKLLVFWISMMLLSSCKNDKAIKSIDSEIRSNLDDSEKVIVNDLNKYIHLLSGSSPSLDNSDLEVFDIFAGAKIIGLGEATHGSKDFFQMKHRLIKYFVEKHGYRILGFEADMGECLYIDRFITKGKGNIDEVMKKMHFWTWKTEEVKELIKWMRDYNSEKDEADQIHLLGFDCQFTTYNNDLISEYLSNYGSPYPIYIKSIMQEISSIKVKETTNIDSIRYNLLRKKCDSIKLYFEINKNHLITKSGKFEYELISRLVDQSKQFLEKMTKKSPAIRDYYMAENSVWLTTLLGDSTKVILWAHNGHLAKDSNFGKDSHDPNFWQGSQGYYLSEKLGENYKVIGFSFSRGSFRAMSFDTTTGKFTEPIKHTISRLPLRESVNYIFNAANPGNFILVHSDISKDDALYLYLNKPRKFLSVGAFFRSLLYEKCFYEHNVLRMFDSIIHIQITESAAALK